MGLHGKEKGKEMVADWTWHESQNRDDLGRSM